LAKRINASSRDTEKHTPSRWEIEDDMRALLRAEEIKRDRARYARAKKCAAEKLAEMKAAFPGNK
jgi:hypothetical protein